MGFRFFNLGTGKADSFLEVGKSVIIYHQKGNVLRIPFPDHLKGRYQIFTEADLTKALKNL